MADETRSAPQYENLAGVGNNVILTRKSDGQPTLVNLFRMLTADPLEDGGSIIVIDDPKSHAATGGNEYSSKDFRTESCTRMIAVRESLQEILQKQASALKLVR